MQQGYQVKFEDYRIGGHDFRIRSLLDTQQYAASSEERDGITDANWSLFGVVWPAGQLLAREMSTQAIAGRRILEVGCGLALASIVLQRRGADITGSDYHPLMPAFLSANTALNNLGDIDTLGGDWAADNADPELFDLIIGADLLYERGHFSMLAGFIDRHAQPAAEVVIVDPNRGHVGKFKRRMQEIGFSCSEARADMLLANREPFSGRIMRFRRGPGRA